jgi:cystathionine beta-lyase/cystathionine gamma-synthase
MATGIRRALCSASLADLSADFADLAHLARVQSRSMCSASVQLRAARAHIEAGVYREAIERLHEQRGRYDEQVRTLRSLHERAPSATPAPEEVDRLDDLKRAHAQSLRFRQATTAALMVATDWHSPSIAHSLHSCAGRLTDRVNAYHDDYKRDRHPDQALYEHRWLREYVGDPHGHRPRALLFACGMSAVTTVLALLAARNDGRPVGLGAGTYHETREVLEASSLAPQVEVLDESDTGRLLAAIDELDPFALVLDSMCNAASVALVDVQSIIEHLARRGRRTHLVIDNTALSMTVQPWTMLPARAGDLRLVVLESATKYAQLGFDRAAAGVAVIASDEAAELDGLREHTGTNVSDVALHQLPAPNRALLGRRLTRIGRNAALLASSVDRRVRSGRLRARVAYPGLPDHPCHATAQRSTFRGGFLALNASCDAHETRAQIVKAALYEARRQGVQLVEGTSFGFDAARIYLTANHTRFGTPFVRVAAGTEHCLSVARLARVLGDAVEQACGNL